jgi:hypothetical protein
MKEEMVIREAEKALHTIEKEAEKEEAVIKKAESTLHHIEKEAQREEKIIRSAEHALQHRDDHKLIHVGKLREEDESKTNPFSYLIALILILIIIMMSVPFYAVKLDPEPKGMPEIDAVMPYHISALANETPGITGTERAGFLKLMVPDHQAIRTLAVRVAASGCRESDICYAKAVFYFVRDNLDYISDPPNNYLESPFETLDLRVADCDGLAILLANLESAIGIPVRFAFIPNHVYVQIKIDDAPKKYKEADGWISLDPTCNECEFGQVPYSTQNKRKEFLYT